MSPSSLKLASGISASMFTLLAGRKGKGRKARKGHLQLSTTPLRNSWKSWSSFPVTTYWPEVNHMIISSCRVPLFWEAICQAILVFYYTEESREQLKQLQFLQELVVRMCFGGWVTFVRFIHAEYYMLAHSFSLLYIISFCDYLTTSLSGLLFMLFFSLSGMVKREFIEVMLWMLLYVSWFTHMSISVWLLLGSGIARSGVFTCSTWKDNTEFFLKR